MNRKHTAKPLRKSILSESFVLIWNFAVTAQLDPSQCLFSFSLNFRMLLSVFGCVCVNGNAKVSVTSVDGLRKNSDKNGMRCVF